MSTAYLEVRTQHAKRRGMFHGPDTYVAVQIVPQGAERLRSLNSCAAVKREIEILYFGEGYGEHSGPRSKLGRAIAVAGEYVKKYNREEVLIA